MLRQHRLRRRAQFGIDKLERVRRLNGGQRARCRCQQQRKPGCHHAPVQITPRQHHRPLLAPPQSIAAIDCVIQLPTAIAGVPQSPIIRFKAGQLARCAMVMMRYERL
jgi:hypothetical protein